MKKITHLIDLNDFNLNIVEQLLDKAIQIKQDVNLYKNLMAGKIMGSIFFEPSTRTQFSFQTAIFKLGGQFLGLTDLNKSSMAKGESFSDTIKIMSLYSDILVIRHSKDGAARAASLISKCPIINGGDGIHLHPTQTLTDLLTIKELKNRLDGLKIGFCGDLKFSRPINSLVRFLLHKKNNEFFFISSKNLQISKFLKDELKKYGNYFIELENLNEIISQLDVLYMTRVQQERFKNVNDYEIEKGNYKLNPTNLKLTKNDLIIMHPLPRVDEIDPQIDSDNRAVYFLQASNGVFARMALISELFGSLHGVQNNVFERSDVLDINCSNENCVSRVALELPKLFYKTENSYRCTYCDEEILTI